jgi:hypothetical protein
MTNRPTPRWAAANSRGGRCRRGQERPDDPEDRGEPDGNPNWRSGTTMTEMTDLGRRMADRSRGRGVPRAGDLEGRVLVELDKDLARSRLPALRGAEASCVSSPPEVVPGSQESEWLPALPERHRRIRRIGSLVRSGPTPVLPSRNAQPHDAQGAPKRPNARSREASGPLRQLVAKRPLP